jgi:glycosyltransferase involved in cell wall biosynthesis
MKIHTVFISYNRIELTKRAIESYLATVGDDFTYVVVDNGSTDGAAQWLDESEHLSILFSRNVYPGKACNVGWDIRPPDTELLHRADNDFIFLPGWREEVERAFASDAKLGQLGLRTGEEEMHASHNTGGNCVISREMFAQGVRYDETPWPEYPPGYRPFISETCSPLRAPLERNRHMAKLGADLCIAFWNGTSTGTKHMIETAREYDIPVEEITIGTRPVVGGDGEVGTYIRREP